VIGERVDDRVPVGAKAFRIVGAGDDVGDRAELGGGHR
jgi:hypothetical protein